MSINAWKTSFIGLNKPPKVMPATADAFTPVALWPYANDPTDPYWSGGSNPQAYQWKVDFTVIPTSQGSNLTRTPYLFNAQDIEVGDFVAGANDGKVVEIMSILAKTDTTLTAIVEDRLRYNTFRDPTGFGLFGCPGPVVFFQVNELGLPMLDPLPGQSSVNFFSDVQSRFQYMNPLTNYILEKNNHGFKQGQPISIGNAGEFEITDANNAKKYIGTVIYSGPGPNQFILRPSNGVVDFAPGIPGDVGDFIYPAADGSGALTTNPASNRPIFIKIAKAIQTITTGSGIDPTGVDGDLILINRVPITLRGSGSGTYALDDAIALINATTADHNVTAVKVGAANRVISNPTAFPTAYGLIAGYVPFSASINGVTVNFATTTAGSVAFGAGIAIGSDMVQDILAANIPNLIASLDASGNIILTETSGGPIQISNLTPDANNSPFAGAGSASALALLTSANTTTSALRMFRDDGGPMTLVDSQGVFLSTAGVLSGQNGRYAIALNIEQGLRANSTTTVPTITARDALNTLPGDQAWILDAGHGEWALHLWDGNAWREVTNQRSQQTDARTISQEITLPGNVATTIGIITEGRRILNVSVSVTTALVDAPNFYITVGTDVVWYYNQNGAPGVGTYTVESESVTSARSDVVVNIPSNTASGTFKVEVTYV
jgi:hypothetical protein